MPLHRTVAFLASFWLAAVQRTPPLWHKEALWHKEGVEKFYTRIAPSL